jgi:hypoxanthine phosphoribosyltransferase
MQSYKEFLAEILIDEPTLQKRIAELGAEISRDYEGRQTELVLVCILRGGLVFMVDLMRHITVRHQIDFLAVSSYGTGARQTSGSVRLSLDLKTDICGKDVLLVEDIVDSGNTIAYVLEFLHTRQPRSLKICTLLDKEERRETPVPIDYCGFKIQNKFVFGYGLDLDEYYRNLPFVAVVDVTKYQPPA